MLTLDAFFVNEDRHTHNIAVLMDAEGVYRYCPFFDHGAALLSDTTMDEEMYYPQEIKERIVEILRHQMRKYQYLF